MARELERWAMNADLPAIRALYSDSDYITVSVYGVEMLCQEVERLRAALAFHVDNQVRTHREETVDVATDDLEVTIQEYGMPEAGTYRCSIRLRHKPTGLSGYGEGRSRLQAESNALDALHAELRDGAQRPQRADPVHVQQPAAPCDDGCCKNSPCDFDQQPAEHVFIQREDDLTDPWCMCCDAVKRPSAGAGSPSTPTPAATHEFGRTPVKGTWLGGSRHGLCLVCGKPDLDPLHFQRDERAERGNGGEGG